MDIGKIPPHDTEAEQAVLGSMLTDQDAVIDAVEVLKPEDFYRDDNKYMCFTQESVLGMLGNISDINLMEFNVEEVV